MSCNHGGTSNWSFLKRINAHLFLLGNLSCDVPTFTSLYILQFPLCAPRKLLEAQQFVQAYQTYTEIYSIPDRLRWCRHELGMMQSEVADAVGISMDYYRSLEAGQFRRSFSLELADKLAALYGIPVEDILDDYTLFLHRGGGDFLRRYREAKGWNRQQLADHAKVSRTSIRCWESGQKTISQKCFCHLVENLGSDFPSMLRM